MQVQYRLKLGQDEFLLSFDCKNEKDFFEQACFYSNLPRVAPGGSDDLKIVFRKTKKGHRYYSLISDKEKKEYKFGQLLEANGNGLFAKGWEDAYQVDDEGDDVSGGGIQTGQGTGGLGQTATQPQVGGIGVQTAPQVQTQTPAPTQPAFVMPTPVTAPTPQPVAAPALNPQFPGLVNPTVGPTAQVAAATAQVGSPVGQPQVSPQVNQAAKSTLARFGINTNR
jgi:hypothetical protein